MELLLVFAISTILFLSAGPLGVGLFERTQMNTESTVVLHTLRHAQEKSIQGNKDALWGVRFEPSSMILFAGETYATRNVLLDQVHAFPDVIQVTGVSEIHFAHGTGKPDMAGDITITQTSTQRSVIINVNAFGKIE